MDDNGKNRNNNLKVADVRILNKLLPDKKIGKLIVPT